jgi:hypothetical protein
MRGLIFLLIVAAALLWGGGQGLYTALKNREPTRGSCRELTQKKPDKEWLSLEDCVLDFGNGGYLGSAGTPIETLVIPLRPADDEPALKTNIVLWTEDPALVRLFRRLESLGAEATGDEVQALLDKNADTLFRPRQVQGTVKFGIELDDDDREKIAGVVGDVAPDFVLLEHNLRPRWGLHLALFSAGLAILGAGIFLIVRRGRRSKPR